MKNISIFILAMFLGFSCSSQKTDTVEDQVSGDQAVSPRSQKQERPKGAPSVDEVFKMDADGDGLLSLSEVKGPLANDFSKIDTNEDGFISREELENAPKPERGQRRPQRNK